MSMMIDQGERSILMNEIIETTMRKDTEEEKIELFVILIDGSKIVNFLVQIVVSMRRVYLILILVVITVVISINTILLIVK